MSAAPKVRMPPSPTGLCHVGTARMAIINYLFARSRKGSIVFRIEDTDRERSKKEYEDDIIDILGWLGLSWDEFYRQSERIALYQEQLERLIAHDRAYLSEEESKKQAGERVTVVRLRNPGSVITFNDIVRGEITFDTAELGDFVIARAVDDPLYHFTAVVDDALMGITHVIRGEEHISNTPRQILIQEALGVARPAYAHYPLFLGTDRAKLSKRKGDVAVRSYRDQGFLPEALVNYIGTLGWTPPSGRELLTLDDMEGEFELEDLHRSGAVFDVEKLRWFNRHYLLAMPEGDFSRYALPALRETLESRSLTWNDALAERLLPVLRERASVRADMIAAAEEGEYDFIFSEPSPEPALIPQKGTLPETAATHLRALVSMLESAPSATFDAPDRLRDAVWPYATEHGRGDVLWPMRYTLSGRARSPDPFMIAFIIGKERTLARLRLAAEMLAP